MSELIGFFVILVLGCVGSYRFGRTRGYRDGYALGSEAAAAWERTANLLQKKLDSAA